MENNRCLHNREGKKHPFLSFLNDVNTSAYTCGRLSAMMQEDALLYALVS